MAVCREVSKWITENVLVPVTRFITEARETCENIGQWVEEEVWQQVEDWVSREERRCREQDCNWWCACCNKWFCWIVTVLVRVLVWVLVTVVKWVVKLVCKIVVFIIGTVIELVLKVIHRLVTFVVCIFTDPIQAFKTLWDLWNDIVDTVKDIFDFITSILDDIIGIIEDIDKLLSGLGRTFCIFGKEMCAIFGAIFGFLRGILNWIRDIVEWIRDTVDGLKDLISGILTLNLCDITRGLGIFNIVRVLASITKIPGIFYVGPREQISQAAVDEIIKNAIEQAFSDDPQRMERSKRRARLGGSPVGLPIRLDARRMAIHSSEFLRQLHREGVLNIHAIAGRISDCEGKFVSTVYEGEVVYRGTNTTVSQSDIDTFLSDGPEAVAAFTVYPIKRSLFRRYLTTARRKGFQIGLNFTWGSIIDVAISESQFIPLGVEPTEDSEGISQRALFGIAGRPSENEDLSIVLNIAIFGYKNPDTHGLTSWHRSRQFQSPSGVTFRTRFPEVAFQYVLIHEIGHYFGLNHEGHETANFIMWSPVEGTRDLGDPALEILFGSGGPNFTENDAREVWNWITTTPQATNTCLP
ncbi:MAG: hypothetical protein IT262_14460 [Saprospiraceae bacterium]|nr:hypothetical protein [Saprospiraceae bacterium]